MTTISFETFQLGKELHQAIQEMGFQHPAPIQVQAIPPILKGKDIIGQAQTGSGKTAAFAIPIIERVQIANKRVQALVLCPTRELAIQVTGEFQKLSKYKRGLRIGSLYGGQPINRQLRLLSQKPQIIVGTPGRVQDLLNRGELDLDSANILVLDEADEMLQMGFRDAIERILEYTPPTRQTILFSATMPQSILDLASRYQQDAEHVYVSQEEQPLPKIEQLYIEVHKKGKTAALVHLIESNPFGLALVFCNTKWQVDALTRRLKQAGYSVEGLHGGMTQSKRDKVMRSFRDGSTRLLVATDVAARGIDVDNVEAVFNYDFPKESEFYIHRIGRTGRAGKSGQAFTFVEFSEMWQLSKIQQYPNVNLTRKELPALA